ncbi:peroxidase family protein [Gloeobacter violaceus]|nr:heme peroxidase family protein [Gloeobacter violaceus]
MTSTQDRPTSVPPSASRRGPEVRRHGHAPRTGEQYPLGEFVPSGKFGRMFARLRPLLPPNEALIELGLAMGDVEPNTPEGDNPEVPAGYTYLGQFIDHDITFDTTSLQETLIDPQALTNFRSPMLDLDSVYGSGPAVQPYLYRQPPAATDPVTNIRRTGPVEELLVGLTNTQPGAGDADVPVSQPNDLPRNAEGTALLGDQRNDENLIVAQLHVAFLKAHNKLVRLIRSGEIPSESPERKSPFEEARDLLIWHYQWIVLHDFLPRIIEQGQLDDVLKNGRRFYQYKDFPFIPVEFSVAVYRLGHSMIRSVYDYNRVFTPRPGGVTPATLDLLFRFTAKSGEPNDFANVPVPSDWIIDWRRFFDLDASLPTNPSRKLDPFLVEPLSVLPNVEGQGRPDAFASLAVRNLLRGKMVGLPPGQSVALRMGMEPLSPEQIAQGPDGAVAKKHNLHIESPLWYYVLKEAQIKHGGRRLGPVGSRILAEVFVGLLEGDSSSFLNRCPTWKPKRPIAREDGRFTAADLIAFMGDVSPIDGLADPAGRS